MVFLRIVHERTAIEEYTHGMIMKSQVSQYCQWRELNAAKYEVLVRTGDLFQTLDALYDGGHSVWEGEGG
jgi:hypothetical protein